MMDIPDDILIAIATQLRREPTVAPLFCFIRVCRRWNALGLPLLYGNISLATRTLEPFARTFLAEKYGPLVRSLSLRVGAIGSLFDPRPFNPSCDWDDWNDLSVPLLPSEQDPDATHEDEPPVNNPWLQPKSHERVVRLISTFPLYGPLLERLPNLASFSLVIEAHASWCLLPRATIATLVDALPASCTHLEIDTHGIEKRDYNHPTHICEHIRRVLPRMRNVRLRLGTMCSALFESGNAAASEPGQHLGVDEPKQSKFIALSHLQSLVVNCGVSVHGEILPQCGSEGFGRYEIGVDAWCAITSSLIELVRQQTASLKNTKILVLSPTWGVYGDLSLETHLRTDLVNKTTWAVPCIPEGRRSSVSHCFLVRCPDGSEHVIRDLENVDDIAEGYVWRNAMGGARLPATILNTERKGLPSFATGCVARPAEDLMVQWRWVYPDVPKSRTFRNEQKTGMKLVLAEKRIGHHFLALRPVEEMTPNGWVRTPDLDLVPAESSNNASLGIEPTT